MVLQAPIGFAILLNEANKAEEKNDWHLFPIYKGLRTIFLTSLHGLRIRFNMYIIYINISIYWIE